MIKAKTLNIVECLGMSSVKGNHRFLVRHWSCYVGVFCRHMEIMNTDILYFWKVRTDVNFGV